MFEKLFSELKPYLAKEQYSLFYFLLIGFAIIALHMIFERYYFVKYLPGVILIFFGIMLLLFNGYSSILQTSPDKLRYAALSISLGLFSIVFARILAIMYKRPNTKRRIKKHLQIEEGDSSQKKQVDR